MTASCQATRVCIALMALLAASCRAGSEQEVRTAKGSHDAARHEELVPQPPQPPAAPRLRLAATFAHDLDGVFFENFAAGRNTVALGGRSGERDPGSVRTWTRDGQGVWRVGQRIEAPKPLGLTFGQAVAIFDTWMAVGEPYDCPPGAFSDADVVDPPICPGWVHLYREEKGRWHYTQRLDDGLRYPSKLAPAGSRFGEHLSMAAGTLLVGGDLGTWLFELEGARWMRKGYEHQCGPYAGVIGAATNGKLTAYSFPEPKQLGSCHNGHQSQHLFEERHRRVAALRIELRERSAEQWRTISQVRSSPELFIPSARIQPSAHIEFCGDALVFDDGRLFSAYRRAGEAWGAVSSAWINQACDPGRWTRHCFFACSREHVVASNFGGSGLQLHYGAPDDPSPRILPMPEGTLPSHLTFAASDEIVSVAYLRDAEFNDKLGGPRLPPIRGLAIFEWSDSPVAAP